MSATTAKSSATSDATLRRSGRDPAGAVRTSTGLEFCYDLKNLGEFVSVLATEFKMEIPEKIFLCWSKFRSRSIATAWAKLLPEIINGVEPILSTEFQKGKEWSRLLRRDLDEARTGIVFLTPENVNAPWIHFEAGALARALGNHDGDVFTYIYGFDPGKLAGPLSAYHSTVATKVDTQRLVHDLCAALKRKPPDETAYSAWWVKLEKALDNIPAPGIPEIVPGFAGLFERKTFHEPLPDCTNQRWLDRFAAARAAYQALTAASRSVDDLGRPGSSQLYRELIAAVDGYAMAMSGFLVDEKHFDFDDDGKLDAPKGAIAACELRRKRVIDFVAKLSDPKNDTPVFGESIAFDELAPEHRKSFIHRWEARLEGKDELPVRGNWLSIALRSEYDFDRIAGYIYQEKRRPSELVFDLEAVRREFERRRIQPKGSYMPLHYSLRALSTAPEFGRQRDEVERELRAISEFLLKAADKKKTDPLFSAIERVRAVLKGSVNRAKRSKAAVAGKSSRVRWVRR